MKAKNEDRFNIYFVLIIKKAQIYLKSYEKYILATQSKFLKMKLNKKID